MAVRILDTRGLKCPQPTLKAMAESHSMPKGDILEVVADCPTFEHDMRSWCERTKKTMLWMKVEDGNKRCQIRL
jgi:tRNA 2-thiouridine synthesizing protein A